ncbi:MAG TPA: branched-chain amino acid ABC transporter permease [Candidatus Nitrosotalea sp.]|nr:branched-chain amino acid ABC transporter permease [Candidatus Nitrosotalea sp.]
MSSSTVALTVLAGLSAASVLFLVASGLSLVFGALRVINMAHGSLYMVGAFLTTAIVGVFSQPTIGFVLALVLAPVAVALIGALIEVLVLRRLYGREHLLQLLATYALVLVFAGGVRIVFGSQNRIIRPPDFLTGGVSLGTLTFPTYKLFLMFAALVVAAGLYVLLYRTTLGRNVRAAVADPELLNASGVNVARLFTTVFMIGAGLAALGGVLISPDQAVGLGMDTDVLVAAFAISVIGGLGSLTGSFVGALIVGLATSFGIMFPQTSRWSLAFIFVLMAVVLMIRPWGLFGRPETS